MSFLAEQWGLAGGMVIVFGLGYWLNILEKPYPTLLLTIHKLLPLAIAYLAGKEILKAGSILEMSRPDLAWFLLGILLLISTVATGALLSVDKEWPLVVGLAHQWLPYLTVAVWGLLTSRILL